MTASVPTAWASLISAGTAPGRARAARGSATIGASVPSKSVPISARPGLVSSASSPACPSGVADRGGHVTQACPSSGENGRAGAGPAGRAGA